MQMIMIKGFIGFMCGIVFDMIGFFLLSSKLSTHFFDMVLIATPIIFAICGMLTELWEYAEKRVRDYTVGFLWIHVWVLLLTIIMAIIVFLTNALKNPFWLVLLIIFTFLIVECFFQPGTICRWNGVAAVMTTLLTVPVFSLYIVLIVQSLLLICLLGIVGFFLLVQNY